METLLKERFVGEHLRHDIVNSCIVYKGGNLPARAVIIERHLEF